MAKFIYTPGLKGANASISFGHRSSAILQSHDLTDEEAEMTIDQLKQRYPFQPKQIVPSASIAIETTRAEPVPETEKKIMPDVEHGSNVPLESRLHLENDRT